MSRESKLAKSTAILSIGTFLPKLASFITTPILTMYLTKEEYGRYDNLCVLVSLLLPAATLQISTAAFRFLIDRRKDMQKVREVCSTMLAFILPVSVLALALLYLILPGAYDSPTKIFVCAYFAADILVNALRQIVRGLGRNMQYSISAIVSAFFKMVFAVVFIWYLRIGLFGGVLGLFGASTISLVVLFFHSKAYQFFSFREARLSCLKEMLAYSWPLVPNSMSLWVMRLSDRLVVTGFLGAAVNGIYVAANKIPSLLNLAHNTFSMAWFENASIVSKDDDVDAYYSAMFRTMFDLMAGALGMLICVTPVLFIFIDPKNKYPEAYFQMPVLFLAMFFQCMSTFLGGIYSAFKRTKSVGITTVTAAVTNLVIDLALIKVIGLYAASGSTLVSYVLLFVFRAVDVRKFCALRYDLLHICLVIGLLILECVLSYFQTTALNIVNVVLGIAAFFLLNRAFVRTVFKKCGQAFKKLRNRH